MRVRIIPSASFGQFVAMISECEEIRPVPLFDADLTPTGKFLIQDNLEASGPAYAAEAEKPHYSALSEFAICCEPMATASGEILAAKNGHPIKTK